jgi:hypothetical protein
MLKFFEQRILSLQMLDYLLSVATLRFGVTYVMMRFDFKKGGNNRDNVRVCRNPRVTRGTLAQSDLTECPTNSFLKQVGAFLDRLLPIDHEDVDGSIGPWSRADSCFFFDNFAIESK